MLASALRFHDVIAGFFHNAMWRGAVQALYVICPKPQEIEDGITTLVSGHGGFPWFAAGTSRDSPYVPSTG